MFTIDGQQWALLEDAAKFMGVSHQAMRKWVYRHKDIPTRKVGTALVVQLISLTDYEKRPPRKK